MESPVLHIDLAVPQGWHELSDKQLRYAFELIAKGFTSDEIKTLCLFRWSGLSVRHHHNAEFICRLGKRTFRLTALQIAECLPALDWLDTIPPQPVCISRIGRYRPFAPDFSEVAFEKFIICDNLYQGYLATQCDDLLDQLASILYNHNLSPHNLSPAHRVSIFYWFASVKDLFARLYPNFFQTASQPDNLLGGSRLPSGAQIQQAVNAMIRALTKGDITKEREILALDTHRALTELDAQAKEYKEFNAKFPKK
ncbi:hypothetical protein ED328_07645 [Muribaculaceae bacterium Isolate-001 (NCI)]|nr:hypothetical protein ED328_07645 [Muribaculaceae bacterium Isolate-001 (NCI)]